ncbi:MAG: hypothetical protein ACF8SC_11580 [Phycisphaerales bacterium JB037]
MARRTHGRIDGQLIGLIAACVTALLSFGILGWFIFRSAKPAGPAAGEDLTPPAPVIGQSGRTGPGMGRGRGLSLEFTADDDPTQRIGTLRTGTLDPLPGRHFDAGDLKGELYLDDGRALAIEAPRGKLYMPRDDSLESGTLRGGVQIRLYDPRPDGTPANPATDQPALTAVTPELRFDFALSEIETPGLLSVSSKSVDFEGGDVKVIFNKPRERLELVEVRRGGTMTYRPERGQSPRSLTGAAEPAADRETVRAAPPTTLATNERSARSSQPPPNRPANPQPAAEQPVNRSFYRIVCSSDVNLTMGDRVLQGDQLEVWVHLIDNALHDNAFGRPNRQARALPIEQSGSWLAALGLGAAIAAQPEAVTPPSTQPDQPADAAERAEAIEPAEREAPEPVTLGWEQGLTLRALDERPAELTRNHVAARMTAVGTGLVQFEDRKSGARGRCASLDYLATDRFLTLTGPGRRPVALEVPETGRLDATRVEFSLATGVIAVPGPGTLTATDPELADLPGSRDLAWSERADFELILDEQGELTGMLREAWFTGAVEARDGGSLLAGDHLAASFTPRADASGSDLARLDLTGNARVRDTSNALIRGESVTALFAESRGAQGDPERVVITRARIEREGSSLVADTVDAALARSPEDELTVDTVLARGSVRIERPDDQLVATADEVRAEAALSRATLTGPLVTVAIGNGTLTGTQVEVNGEAEQVEVFGAGTFTLTDDDAPHLQPGDPALTATWTTQMFLDDAAGSLKLTGGVQTIWKPEPLVTNDVTAERVTIEFDKSDAPGSRPSSLGVESSDRTVRRVVATGGSILEPDGSPAVVQSLREGALTGAVAPADPAGAARPVERLLRLEAPEIVADNLAGTITVDQPGRLVLADLRGDASAPSPTEPAADNTADSPGADSSSNEDGAQPRPTPGVIMPTEPTGDQPDLNRPITDQPTDEQPEAPASSVLADSGLRGSALFTWQGSLLVDENTGRIVMSRGVTMTHIRLGDSQRSDLLCDQLTAEITPNRLADADQESVATGPLEGAEFERVLAEGAVHLRSGDQEIFADSLIYDAVTGIAEAIAAAGNTVTFFDEKSGAPVSARRLWWDLIEGRIEVRQPGSVSAPR